ncbi:MAG: hypothetical protein ACOYMZ_02500 [Minisyncoccia bacterium]
MTQDIFAPIPEFFHNGEVLPITEIAQNKKVISLTIAYLSKGNRVSVGGIKGLFGAKKTVQEEKELVITDMAGINLFYTHGIDKTSIQFSEKKEFEKLADNDYDESTLFKRYVMTLVQPYRIHFPIGNVKKIAWI